jgi:HPt (histidine-containing phosphotransfer) domain-containing protein
MKAVRLAMTSNHARKMAELKREFFLRTREDIKVLRRAREDGALRASQDLKTLVHRLSGVTGMFGYESVSDLAAELEDALATSNEGQVEGKLGTLIAAVEVMLNDTA